MIVTVDDLKAHMGLLEDEEPDDLLTAKIEAAESWCGSYIGQSLDDLNPVPAPVKEAVLRLAADLCELREATFVGNAGSIAETLPFGITDLLAPYRAWNF